MNSDFNCNFFCGLETHDWNALVEGVQNYIGSLNWGYRVALREAKVNYLNEFAEFKDEHTLLVSSLISFEELV